MGYTTFAYSGKSLVKSEDIGPGQIVLSHLSPALFTEFKKIGLHAHSGQGSVRIKLSDLTGAFGVNGFYMTSADGSKWKITVSDAGALVVTAA